MTQTNKINILKYEMSLWNQGLTRIAGVDEVGRGCLAGPLVTAAVVWNHDSIENMHNDSAKYELLEQITDSKKIPEKKRDLLSEFIINECEDYSIHEASVKNIDDDGVGEVNKNALRVAVLKIHKIKPVEHVLVDHFSIFSDKDVNDTDIKLPETSITKGDQMSLSIASASIIAKVYRDKLMKDKYHNLYPQYGFDTNVGYGTKKHRDAVKKYGQTEVHRKSFKIT